MEQEFRFVNRQTIDGSNDEYRLSVRRHNAAPRCDVRKSVTAGRSLRR